MCLCWVMMVRRGKNLQEMQKKAVFLGARTRSFTHPISSIPSFNVCMLSKHPLNPLPTILPHPRNLQVSAAVITSSESDGNRLPLPGGHNHSRPTAAVAGSNGGGAYTLMAMAQQSQFMRRLFFASTSGSSPGELSLITYP